MTNPNAVTTKPVNNDLLAGQSTGTNSFDKSLDAAQKLTAAERSVHTVKKAIPYGRSQKNIMEKGLSLKPLKAQIF